MASSQKEARARLAGLKTKAKLQTVTETKCLGVTIQSDLKFHMHITSKISKAKQQLGMIKRAFHEAAKDAKKLAYTSLCRPHLEYASAVWDPVLEYQIYNLEMVQHQGVHFISCLKGRASISATLEDLDMVTLCPTRKRQAQPSVTYPV